MATGWVSRLAAAWAPHRIFSPAVPIRPEHRFFNPIGWPQLSDVSRLGRAEGCRKGWGRPYGREWSTPSAMVAGWSLVGLGSRPVARWTGAPLPGRGRSRHPCPLDPDGFGRRTPRSRHLEQRRRQPRGLLPARPHDPSRAGGSAAAHAFSAEASGDVFGGPSPPSGSTGCYGSSLSATPRSASRACCRPSSVSILNHRRRHSSVLAASPAGGFSAKNRSTGTPRASASRFSVVQSGSSIFLMSSAKP